MARVKGILIDPFACSITEIEHESESLDGIYALLSLDDKCVTTFTCVYSGMLQPGDAIYVDDEALIEPCERYFMFPGCLQPYAGKGLILGSDAKGRTADAQTLLPYVELTTFFLERQGSLFSATVEPWVKK